MYKLQVVAKHLNENLDGTSQQLEERVTLEA